MRPENWMDLVFGTRARVRVLRAMARDPGRYWVERELARAVGMSPSTVNQAVGQLRDLRILESHALGNANVLRLRESLYLNRLLTRFFKDERDLWKRVEAEIRRGMPRDVAVYLYGSTGRGEAAAGSDIDFFLVAPTPGAADGAASKLRDIVQRHLPAPLDVIALDEKRFRSPRHRALVRTVLREGRPLTARELTLPR